MCSMYLAFGQSLARRQGLRSIGSSRQLAAPHQTPVQEELSEDTSSAGDCRVQFDVGDDIS